MKLLGKNISVLFLTTIVALFLVGCDTIMANGQEDKTQPVSTFNDGATNENGSAKHFLGRGYNIFSEYAQEKNVKEEILDFDAMKKAGILYGNTLEETKITNVSGSTVEEYSKNYNAAVGVSGEYAGFTGSVKSTFGENSLTNKTTAFASIIGNYVKYLERVNQSSIKPSSLIPYMTDSIKESISEINKDSTSNDIIDKIFKVYGTHIITGAYHGGYLSYGKTTENTSITSANDFSIAVQAGYSAATGWKANTDDSVEVHSTTKEAADNATATIVVRGGDTAQATSLINGTTKENLDAWLAGFSDKSKWVLSGFTSGDSGTGLFPISELFPTNTEDEKTIKQNVEAAFDEYKNTAGKIDLIDPAKPVYKVTLDYGAGGFKCNTDDGSGDTSEFYGHIYVAFKDNDSIELWKVNEDDTADKPEICEDWVGIKGGKSITIESQNLNDKFQLRTELIEDDGNDGDDIFHVSPSENNYKEEYSFQEIKDIIASCYSKIYLHFTDGDDTADMRIDISFEQYTR